MSEKRKILIVEDHPIFRLGLSELINQEEDLIVCGHAEDVNRAWEQIQKLTPDMILADITLHNSDGIELVRQLNHHSRKIPVLMLSMHDELLYAERSLQAGAMGYIMKQEAMESVVSAIRHVLAGKIYLNEKVKEHILSHLADRFQDRDKSPGLRLTDREMEVFGMIGKGLSTRQIAANLHLSIKTIGTYRERIKEKLNVRHTNELVRCAVHWEKTGELSPAGENA
jgi:DNA-binding NarL/FixJ family response regulator